MMLIVNFQAYLFAQSYASAMYIAYANTSNTIS